MSAAAVFVALSAMGVATFAVQSWRVARFPEAAAMSLAGFRTTELIKGAHPQHPEFWLLPGDLLVRDADGTFTKEAPGICVVGFVLTPEQQELLRPVVFERHGLSYRIGAES